jgi:hypothetical protein
MRYCDVIREAARERGIVYISANNNMDYWGGYLFSRDRFKRVSAVVTLLDPVADDDEPDIQWGIVKIKNVTLRVRRFDASGEWEIDEELKPMNAGG